MRIARVSERASTLLAVEAGDRVLRDRRVEKGTRELDPVGDRPVLVPDLRLPQVRLEARTSTVVTRARRVRRPTACLALDRLEWDLIWASHSMLPARSHMT